MIQCKRVAIDTSKAVFTLHGIDQNDRPVLRINLRRAQMIPFFTKLVPTEIAMEACGGAHHWARELSELGHEVHLIPPQYVKPYVKRSKNDRNDAEAICEAAGRPGMHFVPVKSVTQQSVVQGSRGGAEGLGDVGDRLSKPGMPILPFKLHQDCRHHIPRQRHRVTNWPAYDASLRQRGSLTVWFTDDAIAAWAGVVHRSV